MKQQGTGRTHARMRTHTRTCTCARMRTHACAHTPTPHLQRKRPAIKASSSPPCSSRLLVVAWYAVEPFINTCSEEQTYPEGPLSCLLSTRQGEVPRFRDSAGFLQGQGELFLAHGFQGSVLQLHKFAQHNKAHSLRSQQPSHTNHAQAPMRGCKLQIRCAKKAPPHPPSNQGLARLMCGCLEPQRGLGVS